MKKIILILTILLITISTAYAVNIENLKVAPDWEYNNDGQSYILKENGEPSGFTLYIFEYTDSDYADFFNNNTEDGYIVEYLEKGTALYSSELSAGSLEVVEIDNVKYIIDFGTTDNYNADSIHKTYDEMLAFNTLNNVTPVEQL